MKRFYTLLVAAFATMTIWALAHVTDASAPTAAITLTAEVDGTERTFEFNTAEAGTKISIDWGDGNIVEACEGVVYDGWETAKATGVVKGDGIVKIYGEGITNFDCVSKVTGASITALDLSAAQSLKYLSANGNVKLTALDLTACTELEEIVLSNDPIKELDLTKCVKMKKIDINGVAATPCALKEIDLSKNTELTTLRLNFNELKKLDLTNNTKLTSIYALNNEIEDLILPAELPACTYLSLNYNNLTRFDGAPLTAMSKTKGSIFLMYNELREVKNLKAKSVNITGNQMRIYSMPDISNVGTLTYAPQQEIIVDVRVSGSLDLSAEYDNGNTTYAMIYEDGTAVAESDYSVNEGVVTFGEGIFGKSVIVTMTSATWPMFAKDKALKTSPFIATSAATPAITLTAQVDGKERTFEFCTAEAGTKISIDWGDGNIVEACEGVVYDGWETAKATGVVKNIGNVKIYGEGITYFDCVSKVSEAGITALDVFNAQSLKYLYANGNVLLTKLDLTGCTELEEIVLSNDPIEELDLTKCVKMRKIDINGVAATPCALEELDLSKNTELTSLKLNFNKLKKLDLTNNTKLTQVYALNNYLTDVILPAELPACTYLSLNNNELTSFDGSALTGMSKTKGNIFLINNKITTVSNLKAKSVNISNNMFTIANMPDVANVGTLTYVPQNAMPVSESVDVCLDLSAEYDNGNTTYAVMNEDGTAVDAADYSVENGIITFFTALQGKKVYVTMTSATWANFKGNNALKTTVFTVSSTSGINAITTTLDASAPVFNIQGQRVGAQKGVMIQNGRKFTVK